MSLSTRKLNTGIASLVFMLLLVVAIVVINLIAARNPGRLDMTADRRYTLAEASIAVAETLPGPVRVELFFSEGLPSHFDQMRRDITDLLNDYAAYSDDAVTFEFIDPSKDEDDRARAEAYGVMEFPLQVFSESEASLQRAFCGMVFIYDDEDGDERSETLARVLPGENYEYNMTRTLRDITAEEEDARTRLGILIGEGGFLDMVLDVPFDPQNPVNPDEIKTEVIGQLGLFFEDLYDFDLVDISSEDIPDDIDALFVIGSTEEYDDDMKFRLDQFIMSGRPVALSVSPYALRTQEFDQPNFPTINLPSPNPTGLGELLETYGLILEEDALVEFNVMSSQVSVVQQGSDIYVVPDPRLPVLTGLSQTSLLVPQMPMVAFLTVDRRQPLSQSSLTLTEVAEDLIEDGALEADAVIRTSPSTYRFPPDEEHSHASISGETLRPFLEAYHTDPDNPEFGDHADEIEEGPFAVAYTLAGEFTSHFVDDNERNGGDFIESTDRGRIFVVANGDWIQGLLNPRDPLMDPRLQRNMGPGPIQQFMQYKQSSELLFRNTADWLAQDTELVRIRVRAEPAYLDSDRLTDDEKTRYKFFNIAGIPLVFCFLGLIGFLVRQFRRSQIFNRYNA